MSKNESWTLTPELRHRVASRAGANIGRLAFEAKKDVTETHAKQTAERMERDAYAAAQAQATTTTGTRPTQETTKIYVRKLAELVVEFAKRDTTESIERNSDETVFDLSGGSRDFLSKESAEALFRPLLEKDAVQIDTVVLSTKSFGVDAAGVAAKALEKVSDTLHVANLSDIIGGRPEHEALEVLEKLSAALSSAKLRQVDLSNNALGEKGLRACKSLFASQPSLESLSLHNVGCSPDACTALHELTSGMQLKELLLYNNMSGDEGGAAIGELLAKMPSMERFQMASSRVGSHGVRHLTKGLCSATGLLSLDLNDNPATEECIPEIITLLQSQHQLRRLNLSDTSLGDEGVQNLAAALVSAAPDLEELELALNEIALEGSMALGRAVAVKKKLRRLDLHENEMEDAGVVIIAKALSTNTSLEEMNLNCNSVHRIGAVSCAKALKGKPNFKHLSLDENQISTKGITEVRAILSELFGDDRVLAPLDENEDESDDENKDQLSHIDVQHSTLDGVIDAISALSLNA